MHKAMSAIMGVKKPDSALATSFAVSTAYLLIRITRIQRAAGASQRFGSIDIRTEPEWNDVSCRVCWTPGGCFQQRYGIAMTVIVGALKAFNRK